MSILTRDENEGSAYWVGGSGINWGEPMAFGPVAVTIGKSWPDGETVASYRGTWEEAQPFLSEINAFLAAHGSGPARPNHGSLLSTAGFETRAYRESFEAKSSERRARYEASCLLAYRRSGQQCPRRDTLERVVSSGKADGIFLQDRDLERFFEALS